MIILLKAFYRFNAILSKLVRYSSQKEGKDSKIHK